MWYVIGFSLGRLQSRGVFIVFKHGRGYIQVETECPMYRVALCFTDTNMLVSGEVV